jgi:hypothetical protein
LIILILLGFDAAVHCCTVKIALAVTKKQFLLQKAVKRHRLEEG